jgi:cysteine synthase/rhodanese-related sulfurtransferase
MLIQQITDLIGKTPSIEVPQSLHGINDFRLYAKLELFNPFGSVKDRVAWALLKDDLESIVKDTRTLIEVSSGNTAKALAGLAGIIGVPFRTVTNRAKVPEVKQILQILGAQIEELPGLSECPDPSDPNNPLIFVEREVATNPAAYFHTQQYVSAKNTDIHFNTTGNEIVEDIGKVDYFIAGLGTAGSSRGIAERLRVHNPNVDVCGVVSKPGDFLPGIRSRDEMHEVGIFDRSIYNSIVEVDPLESLQWMLVLIRKLGVFSGPSGGGALAAAVKYLRSKDPAVTQGKSGVIIICDRFEWYLSYIRRRMPELFGSHNAIGVRSISSSEIENAKELSIGELKQLMISESPLVVDIRANFAYRSGHIPTSINIPDSHLEEMLESGIPFSLERTVVVVCRIGDISRRIAAYLQMRGLTSYSLKGGINEWRTESGQLSRLTCSI